MFKYPEEYRILDGKMGSLKGNEGGAFTCRPIDGRPVNIIASRGEGWEHVSVSAQHSCPIWDEMCAVKDLFWDEEDCALQFHPPKSEYINNHPNVLHMWRRIGGFTASERPPKWMV